MMIHPHSTRRRTTPQSPLVVLACSLALLIATPATGKADQEKSWIQLFNGRDLTGWTPKIRYQKLGDDPKKTFRVEDGAIKVSYENYTEFKETFGHLFYKTPYSHYRLRVEYRFTGNQMKDGPGWAFRNSGIMIHGQDPKTMAEDQDFPVSVEVQLLGGPGGDAKRTTSNLCTPGTHVHMAGKLVKRHCTNSSSKTYNGDQWVTAEVEVHGHELIKHILEGKTVLEYEKPVLDDADKSAKPLIKKQEGDITLSSGTISLQSESHPVEFRKVEILPLEK